MDVSRPLKPPHQAQSSLATPGVDEPVRAPVAVKEVAPPAAVETHSVYLGPKFGTKSYQFPTHFQKVEMLVAQVVLPSKAVGEWLEKSAPDLKPVSFLGMSRGLVTVQHLGQPAQMDPYFEGSFAVQVRRPDGTEGWHVLEMPVTSEENKERGRRIFGYKKEMSQVEIEDQGGRRVGSAKTEDGRPLFSLGIGASLPLSWTTERKNHNLQHLHDRPVDLDSTLRGRLKLGLGHVDFGEEMQRLYPGLPSKPMVLFGGRITDADLFLSLPRGSEGQVIVPPSAEPRIL